MNSNHSSQKRACCRGWDSDVPSAIRTRDRLSGATELGGEEVNTVRMTRMAIMAAVTLVTAQISVPLAFSPIPIVLSNMAAIMVGIFLVRVMGQFACWFIWHWRRRAYRYLQVFTAD
jgi:hypothetical protein